MLCNLQSISFSHSDLDDKRLEMAKKLGANYTFKIKSRDGREVSNEILKEFGESDKTIECTGVESSITSAIYVNKNLFKNNI